MPTRKAKPRQKRSIDILAAEIELSRSQIEKLVEEGVLARPRRGYYPRHSNVVAYIRYLRRRKHDGSKPGTLDFARSRKVNAGAELAEMQLGQLRGKLITVDDATKRLAAICEQLRSRLLNFAGKYAPQVLGIHTIAEAQLRLQDAILETMTELSAVGDEEDPDEPDASDGANDRKVVALRPA